MPRRSLSTPSNMSNNENNRLRKKRSGLPAASTFGHLAEYQQQQRSASWSSPPKTQGDLIGLDEVPSRVAALSEHAVRPGLPDRSQELFEAKREARRQRRILKQTGDFLGVQGVNPHTGVLDMLTPTTASSETVTDPIDRAVHPAQPQATHARPEARERYRHEGSREHKTAWRREHGLWSSVAEPQLSPIAQSSTNSATPTPSDKAAVRRKPLAVLPGPFLGVLRDVPVPRRSAVLRRVDETVGQVKAPWVKDVRLAREPSCEPSCEPSWPLSPRTNDTCPAPGPRQGGGSATVTSSRSTQRSIQFRVPPPVPRRTGPTDRDTSPVKGRPYKEQEADQGKWTGAHTPPPPPRRRPTTSAPPFTRIPSEQLTDGGAEVWADMVLQDINQLGNHSRDKGRSQRTNSPWGSTVSVSTPTTTTTGSGGSLCRLHPADPAAFAGALVLFRGLGTPTRTSTESSSTTVPPSTPSSAGASRASSQPPASRPSMTLSVWQSPPDRPFDQPSRAETGTDALEDLPWPQPPPRRPSPSQPSDTTSAIPSTPTTGSSETSSCTATPRSGPSTEKSPRAWKEVRATMRLLTAAAEKTPRRAGQDGSSSGSSNHSVSTTGTTTMAQGAARMAFVQHATSARLVDVPKKGKKLERDGKRSTSRQPTTEAGSTGEDEEGIVVLPGQMVGLVCRSAARFLTAYWLLVRPVFDGGSALRQRSRWGKSTWRDYGVCGLALAFLLLGGTAAMMSVRGVVMVLLGTRAMIGAIVLVLGLPPLDNRQRWGGPPAGPFGEGPLPPLRDRRALESVTPQTLYDKVFQAHIVDEKLDGTILLYIDRHLVHEVTSPQAFEGLKNARRHVRRPDCTLATVDHNIPTTSRKTLKDTASFIDEEDSRTQCVTLEDNVKDFGVTYFGLGDKRQGIVHVIGPEQGFTLPGTTVVCGDSHTSTHGAFGALAFGIGTSEVEHVLATQCLITKRSRNMRVQVDGRLAPGVSSKDVVLHVIGRIGTAGGTGAVIEFCGDVIRHLSIEARMSICNMSIEAGARAGMVAPDDTTFEYLKGRPLAPEYGSAEWDKAVAYWRSLRSDPGAKYDVDVFVDAKDIVPTVSWGTSPEDVVPITGLVPDPETFASDAKKAAGRRMLEYMGLTAGTPMQDIVVDKVFIGSCTNSRIEDLRAAAEVVKGKKVAANIKRAMVVPGSGLVKEQAEREGLDHIFTDAGFEWREAGCSMCLGMNPDILAPKERCASTSNRNFEGRQGAQGRTHLMSPVMAAAAAIVGKLADVRKLADYKESPHVSAAINPSSSSSSSSSLSSSSSAAAAVASPSVEKAQPDDKMEMDEAEKEAVADVPLDSSPQVNTKAASPGLAGLPTFTVLRGIAAPMEKANIDTDAIIPKQFLKTIKRTGLGSALFYEMRFHPDGTERADFVLNREPYRRARILVCTGANFGCGSSREHAPWALNDFGVRSVLAPSFADIFFNNSFKNGMLPIAIDDADALARVHAEAAAGRELEIDLPAQEVRDADGRVLCRFDVDAFRKHCLVNGLDDIGLTMQLEDKIADYEARMARETPWLDGRAYLKRKGQGGKLAAKAVPVPKTNRGEEKTEPLEW
ncbi:hypothetical protein P8C59_006844 [Phyllachora maydis]|uniref:3-isopropylmalate dehydratase n=1 Tax=Phyllachora maydis TaxID=1825666 RepID=A0AAD9MCX9_9PEZI|nr:hypothetical protein P8C59_006844 [Phyllachora maydis]